MKTPHMRREKDEIIEKNKQKLEEKDKIIGEKDELIKMLKEQLKNK